MIPLSCPTTPNWQRHWAITPIRFRLIRFRSPLLTESLLLYFPPVTEMFQFTEFPLLVLCVQTRVTPHYRCRVSPFGHLRIVGWSAPPRNLSQPPTSFIGSRRQGIHRWPLLAWISFQRCSCSQLSSQGTLCDDRVAPRSRDQSLALPHNGIENAEIALRSRMRVPQLGVLTRRDTYDHDTRCEWTP